MYRFHSLPIRSVSFRPIAISFDLFISAPFWPLPVAVPFQPNPFSFDSLCYQPFRTDAVGSEPVRIRCILNLSDRFCSNPKTFRSSLIFSVWIRNLPLRSHPTFPIRNEPFRSNLSVASVFVCFRIFLLGSEGSLAIATCSPGPSPGFSSLPLFADLTFPQTYFQQNEKYTYIVK